MEDYEKISMDVFGLNLLEPMAFVTNYCIVIACYLFYQKLNSTDENDKSIYYWRFFFLSMSIAAGLGGLAHLLHNYLPFQFRLTAWAFTGISIAAAEMGAAHHPIISDKFRSFLLKFSVARLFIYLLAIYTLQDFTITKINSSISLMGIVAPIYFIDYLKSKNTGSLIVTLGISTLLIPAIIHSLSVSPHRWLNKDDLSHLIMVFCIYLIFLGVKQAHESETENIPSQ